MVIRFFFSTSFVVFSSVSLVCLLSFVFFFYLAHSRRSNNLFTFIAMQFVSLSAVFYMFVRSCLPLFVSHLCTSFTMPAMFTCCLHYFNAMASFCYSISFSCPKQLQLFSPQFFSYRNLACFDFLLCYLWFFLAFLISYFRLFGHLPFRLCAVCRW